jgi:Helix-turn-helix domain
MSDHNREMMIESLQLARGEPPPPNPPPEPKWQAKQGLQRLKLNGPESAVLWLLIDYANGSSGLCFPSQARLALVLDLPLRTVERAVASLRRRRLIRALPRRSKAGAISSAYLINWQPIFAAYREMRRAQKVAVTPPSKVATTPRQKWRGNL